jgi:membrane associated rhomboid family serine protease
MQPAQALTEVLFRQLREQHVNHCLAGVPLTALELATLTLTPQAVAQAHEPAQVQLRSQLETAQTFVTELQGRKAPVTLALIIASAALFALQMYWGEGHLAYSSWRMGAGNGRAVVSGEVWRLLSAAMLHGGLVHLAMNGMSLWFLGTFLEKVLGSARFLTLFVLSAFAGNLLSALRIDTSSVGASSGIWGLMAACAALVTWPRGALPGLLAMSMRNRVWSVVGINAVISFAPGIDYLAHGGGGLMGFALTASGAMLLGLPRADAAIPTTLPRRRGWTVSAVLSGAALLAAVTAAIANGKPWELQHPRLHAVDLAGTPLEIDLPTSFSPVAPEPVKGMQFFGWERWQEDGLIVVLAVSPEPTLGSEEEWLASKQRTVTLSDKLLMVDAPQIRVLNGKRVVTFSTREPGSPLLTRYTVGLVSGVPVRLETTASTQSLTAAWQGLEHALFFGIRLKGSAR